MVSSFGGYKANIDINVIESAKVSADAIMIQFFYISMLPVNAISKIFVDGELTPAVPINKQNGKKQSKQENSSKASAGYSIVAETINCHFGNVKEFRYLALSEKIKKSRVLVWFESYSFVSIENVYKFGFIIMLLLAILLTRRNIGNDNIRIIKNNKSAQLA